MKIKSDHGWAQRNGYFPNGKLAVKWAASEADAHYFGPDEAKQVRSRARGNGFRVSFHN